MAASIPPTFRAYEYAAFGPDPLELIKLNPSVPQEPLQSNQVRVQVHYASVNPVDFKLVTYGAFMYPDPPTAEKPFRIGFDTAGTIVETGSDVKDFKVGDEVFFMASFQHFGSFAEYLTQDASLVAPKPKSLSFKQAAGVPLVGLTSWHALMEYGELKAGDRVLILGGSTACGILGIQLAKAFGAHVITTASSRNVELVKSLGADEVVDYTKAKWGDVLAAHSIDVVYDCGVEPNTWNDHAQKVLQKETGIFITIDKVQNAIESPIGATLHQIFNSQSAEILKELTKLFDAGKVQIPIDSVHAFENVLDAIKIAMSGRAVGKIIIEIVKE